MFIHPDLLWDQMKQRQHDLIAEADTYRLLAAARRPRRRPACQGHPSARSLGGRLLRFMLES